MHVAWLILDSVSFTATSFADDGPDTTPQLADLADEYGATVFTHAYAPGIASPSSHGSFFTGLPPTETGMHEAYPRFNKDEPTVADALGETHLTYLVSSNRFVFNGLERGFDEYADVLYPDPVFDDAADFTDFSKFADPRSEHYEASTVKRYLRFMFAQGKPFKSLVNGLQFKFGQHADEYQYTDRINERIRRKATAADDDEMLVVANYMDAHAPFNPSSEAIDRFASDTPRSELPIKESGTELNADLRANEPGAEERAERMLSLYHGSIWDLDRELAPLVRDLLDRETAVVITADHGNWFRRTHELEDRRLHVPLMIFTPDGGGNRVDYTVNLQSLPRTTAELAIDDSAGFDGTDLRHVDDHQVSLTEGFHNPSRGPNPVNVHGVDADEWIYQGALIQGDTKITIVGSDITVVRDGAYTDELLPTAESLSDRRAKGSNESIEYDDATERRLRDLGYVS